MLTRLIIIMFNAANKSFKHVPLLLLRRFKMLFIAILCRNWIDNSHPLTYLPQFEHYSEIEMHKFGDISLKYQVYIVDLKMQFVVP